MSAEQPLGSIPFSPEDEKRIVRMSLFMRIAGALAAVTALLQTGAAALRLLGFGAATAVARTGAHAPSNRVGDLIGSIVSAVIAGFLAAMLLRAGQAFSRMATTEGQDQALLGEGLRRLKAYFLVKSVLILVAIGFVCLLGPLLAIIVGSAASVSR